MSMNLPDVTTAPSERSQSRKGNVRIQEKEGDILIQYGYDTLRGGYFLSVVDSRLELNDGDSNESDEAIKICEKIEVEKNGGGYFDINSYASGGWGYNAQQRVVFSFMRRYGIDPEKVREKAFIQGAEDLKAEVEARDKRRKRSDKNKNTSDGNGNNTSDISSSGGSESGSRERSMLSGVEGNVLNGKINSRGLDSGTNWRLW